VDPIDFDERQRRGSLARRIAVEEPPCLGALAGRLGAREGSGTPRGSARRPSAASYPTPDWRRAVRVGSDDPGDSKDECNRLRSSELQQHRSTKGRTFGWE